MVHSGTRGIRVATRCSAWLLASVLVLVGCDGDETSDPSTGGQSAGGSGTGGSTSTGGSSTGGMGGTGGSTVQPGDIVDVTFDTTTLQNTAPGNGKSARGCDNWPITEAASGHQVTSWGDGSGFDGGPKASLGVARIEGGKDDYSAFDVFKTGTDMPGWDGKSKGILAIGDTLYLVRSGNGSDAAGYALEELYKSDDGGQTFTLTAATWYPSDFADGKGFSNLTFCQFGPGFTDTYDEYVYLYGFEEQAGDWEVQVPGRIALLRVLPSGIEDRSNYQYFAGFNGSTPDWSADLADRAWVFDDAVNGVMRLSVTYRAPLGKFILMAQQDSRLFPDAKLGIYQADAPWGPFTDAMPDNPADPKTLGSPIPIMADGNGTEQEATKTVFFGLSNKWSDEMGEASGFVMVYTGDWQDEWGSVEGHFVLAPGG